MGEYDGLIGCKTGITNSAGPCFAGYYEMNDVKLAIILCNSESCDKRWSEITDIIEWYQQRLDKSKYETDFR